MSEREEYIQRLKSEAESVKWFAAIGRNSGKIYQIGSGDAPPFMLPPGTSSWDLPSWIEVVVKDKAEIDQLLSKLEEKDKIDYDNRCKLQAEINLLAEEKYNLQNHVNRSNEKNLELLSKLEEKERECEEIRASHKRQCDLNDKAWEKVKKLEGLVEKASQFIPTGDWHSIQWDEAKSEVMGD